MAVSFYMDEHVPGPIVRGLQRRGIDVLTAQEDSHGRSKDLQLLRRATELKRVFVSMDEDFFSIVASEQRANRSFAGVFSIPHSLTYRQAIEDLEIVGRCSDYSEWEGLITRLVARFG
jgi:hypothetical protein